MSADVKKKRLGRGLDALFRDFDSEEKAFTLPQKKEESSTTPSAPRRLNVTQLTPGQFQPRRHFDEAALSQLAESIATHGVLQPLLVRKTKDNQYEIIAGERRWRAAQKAKIHDVPVVIEDLDDEAALEIALIENLQREDLTAIEEAEGYQRLIAEFNHTQDVLADHLGKSRSHIANTLRLLKLPEAVKKLVDTGALSAGHARALVGSSNAKELAGVIVKRGLNVRQTENLVKKAAQGKPVKARRTSKKIVQKDVDTLALEQKMTDLLGLNVTIEGEGSAGKLVIAYKTLEQLDDVLARLSAMPQK